MEEDAGFKIEELKVDGGVSKNNFIMQFLSDMTGISVLRPKIVELTALGAAYMAGLGTGFWKDLEDAKNILKIDMSFKSNFDKKNREEKIKAWHKAVKTSLYYKE